MTRISTRSAAVVGTLLVLAAFAGQPSLAQAPAAIPVDSIPATGGPIVITPLVHSSFQLEHAGLVILVDPWSGGDRLSLAKPADLILVTDTLGHHLDVRAIQQLRKPGAAVVITPGGKAKLPDGIVLPNGETTTVAGMRVEAYPAYDDYIPNPPQHAKGGANAYLFTLGGKRVLIAGVTECVPELRAVKNVDLLFIAMNQPARRSTGSPMRPPVAAECVKAMGPKVVYPIHFDTAAASRFEDPKAASSETDAASAANRAGVEAFKQMLAGESIDVRIGAFYPPWPAAAGR